MNADKRRLIQDAIRKEGLDGWLFFDHHRRDPLAYKVLDFTPGSMVSRRWYYFIPASGDPVGMVHKIEGETLRELPGSMSKYADWGSMVEGLRAMIGGVLTFGILPVFGMPRRFRDYISFERQQLGHLAEAAARTVSQGARYPVVVLADGAKWIKTEQGRHFPQATCILDWAHLWREVSHAIRVAARAKPLSQRERDYQLSLHRSWLWQGSVDQAVQGLHALGTGLPAEAGETIQQAIIYLENQRPWIGSYEHWRKQGYPVGSGMIERAVAVVINRRMKKRGMRWRRINATAVVALRSDLLNEDWITPQRLRAFP